MHQDHIVADKFTNAYTELQSNLAKIIDSQTVKDPRDPKMVSTTILRPTYHCLQCSAVLSIDERDNHCQTARHQFCMLPCKAISFPHLLTGTQLSRADLAASGAACVMISSMIPLLREFVWKKVYLRVGIFDSYIRVTQLTLIDGKKRKLSAIYPQGEEDKFVLPNSNALTCITGAPRGIFNLGQTCYMSVILQAMVHNPLMRNYFLSNRHDPAECPTENCIACAMTISFTDILATEKTDGHGPIDMLHRSWKHYPVSTVSV